MTGTAYLTGLRPMTDIGPYATDARAAVYVLDPPWIHIEGVTTYVIGTAHQRERVTEIFPCDEDGLIAQWDPIDTYPAVLSHDSALLASGYRVGGPSELDFALLERNRRKGNES